MLTKIHYKTDISTFKNTVIWLFAFANVLVAIILFFKMYIWWKYNSNAENVEQKLIARTLVELITIWSFTIFWFMLVISMYWYIFFKWETYSFTFLPHPDEELLYYMNWRVLLYISFGGMVFQALVLIYDQCQLDFFFLDWERSRYTESVAKPELENPLGPGGGSKSALNGPEDEMLQQQRVRIPGPSKDKPLNIPGDEHRVVICSPRLVPGAILPSQTSSTSCLANDTSQFHLSFSFMDY